MFSLELVSVLNHLFSTGLRMNFTVLLVVGECQQVLHIRYFVEKKVQSVVSTGFLLNLQLSYVA